MTKNETFPVIAAGTIGKNASVKNKSIHIIISLVTTKVGFAGPGFLENTSNNFPWAPPGAMVFCGEFFKIKQKGGRASGGIPGCLFARIINNSSTLQADPRAIRQPGGNINYLRPAPALPPLPGRVLQYFPPLRRMPSAGSQCQARNTRPKRPDAIRFHFQLRVCFVPYFE